jgi:ABC-type glycerol-3-phosphate transport system substrate-binding protein
LYTKEMSGFQVIVTSLFVFFIVAGVAVFALFGGALGGSGVGAVVVWGTVDQELFNYTLDSLRSQDKTLQDVSYVHKDAASYQTELVGAMAAGTGPDLFVISQEQLGAFGDKVLLVPYGVVSQATYLGSYIDEGQLFLTGQGALALPFMVDPLVMYWNRDLFASAGQSQPPQYWADLITLAPRMTSLDASQNVKRSAVALGQWQNVDNAKAVLSALFMQAGDFITSRAANGALAPVFGNNSAASGESPAESALRFYTEFSNPSKTTYSWNRSLPRSADAFVGGQLAVYFGFASEYRGLLERNPNLRFGVALLPQLQGSGSPLTFANMMGLAISRTARNSVGALAVAQKLSSPVAATILSTQTGLPSVRRDTPLNTSANAAASVFVQSSLIARAWVDPNPGASNDIFKAMIESVVSGSLEPAQAVSEAAQSFQTLLPFRAN